MGFCKEGLDLLSSGHVFQWFNLNWNVIFFILLKNIYILHLICCIVTLPVRYILADGWYNVANLWRLQIRGLSSVIAILMLIFKEANAVFFPLISVFPNLLRDISAFFSKRVESCGGVNIQRVGIALKLEYNTVYDQQLCRS